MKGECSVFSISKFITSSDSKTLDAQRLIDTFRCPINPSVEKFLHQNAIDFSKKKQSITHLVCNEYADLLGYFSLTVKPIVFSAKRISNTSKRKIERIGRYDSKTDSYTISAYLLAQLGKNYGVEPEKLINGEDLLGWAFAVVKDVQAKVGGVILFLECEDNAQLKKFYESNGFSYFDKRKTNNAEENELLQYYRFI
jgi:hypothetical protein